MKTVQGIVEGGVVRLPPDATIAEGAKVIVAIVEPGLPEGIPSLSSELEEEDVQFVRACRGRLARELREEDA